MMAALPLWRFAAACVFCLVLALLLASLMPTLARRWPALAAHRAPWLLAQGVVALAFLLGCVPMSLPHIAPITVINVDAVTGSKDTDTAVTAAKKENRPSHQPSVKHLPQPAATDQVALDGPTSPRIWTTAVIPSARYLVNWLPAAWLAIYLVGLTWHSVRYLRAGRRWHLQLVRHTYHVDIETLHNWPMFTPDQLRRISVARLQVRATHLPVSPVLLGGRWRWLVLPDHLRMLDVAQQRLVIEHELTHWRRADPRWLMLAAVGALLFWFNRPYQRLVDGLRDAVELGCDDAVLAGRDVRERQGYAAALVAQLKLERLAHQACAAPAFGQSGIAARVQRMRAARPPCLSLRGRLTCAISALGLATLGTLLQPAFSASVPTTPMAITAMQTAAQPWRYPLAQVRVTNLYGVRSDILPAGNHGVDFAARKGTPVLAVAAGTVIEASANRTWGNYVRIDHGGGVSSLVMHLERATVAHGQRVAAGEVVGASGASGRATGPHLHLEYWLDGRRLDPQLMLADLSDHATARALGRRRAQGNPKPTDE